MEMWNEPRMHTSRRWLAAAVLALLPVLFGAPVAQAEEHCETPALITAVEQIGPGWERILGLLALKEEIPPREVGRAIRHWVKNNRRVTDCLEIRGDPAHPLHVAKSIDRQARKSVV